MILNHPHRNSSHLLSFPIYPCHCFIKFKVVASPAMSRRAAEIKGDPEHYIPFHLGQLDGVPIEGTLYCPFPSGENPHYEEAKQDIESWILKQNLLGESSKEYKKFKAADFAKLCANCYRGESGPELSIVTEFASWLFMHDDFRDDQASKIGKSPEKISQMNELLLQTLRIGILPESSELTVEFPYIDNLLNAILDIRTKLLRKNPTGDLEPFCKSVKQYFEANIWEAHNRSEKSIPGVSTYTKMRQYTSAVFAAFEIGFFLRKITIDKEVREDPLFELLMTNACNAICYTNDIFSLLKEIKEGVKENLVLVIQDEQNKTLGDSLSQACKNQNLEVENYLRTVEELKVKFKHKLPEGFYTLLESWIKGNLDWSLVTMRYNLSLASKNA